MAEWTLMSGWFSNFMNHPATYIKGGWFQMSVSNLIVIILMFALFALALFLPFPKDEDDQK